MAYLDYSPVQLPDHSEGLRRIGDALEAAMRRRDQRRQFEETQKFQREQEQRRYAQQQGQLDYQNRVEDERERRAKEQHEWQRAQMQRSAANDIRNAPNVQAAESMAIGAGGTLTPGEIPDVGPAPQAPVQPGMPPEIAARFRGKRAGEMPSPEAGTMIGPIPSAEELRSAEIQRIASEPDTEEVPDVEGRVNAAEAERKAQLDKVERYKRQFESYSQENPAPEIGPTAADAAYDQQLDQFEAKQAAFPGEQKAYAAAQRSAEARRPYTLQFGDKPGQTFDFETQRYAARTEAADRFMANLSNIQMGDRDVAAAQAVRAGILSGTIPPEKAFLAFQKERMGNQAEGGRNARATDRNETTLEAARIRAAAAGRDWKETMARGNLGLRAEDIGNKEFQDFLRNAGYKGDVAVLKDLVDTNHALAVGNSALDVTAGAQFAKKAQGAGVLTDKDYDRFWAAIGAGEDRTEDWFDRVINGEMGEGKRRVVVDAIRHKITAEENRLRNVATQADKKFANEPWYPGTRAAYFDFVSDLPPMGQAAGPRIGTSGVPTKAKTKPGAPPEVKAKAKGAASRDDEAMQ